MTSFQPVTTTKNSDWITVIIAKITSLASRVWYDVACSMPQETKYICMYIYIYNFVMGEILSVSTNMEVLEL